jgi:hypothetical protein
MLAKLMALTMTVMMVVVVVVVEEEEEVQPEQLVHQRGR